MVSMSGRCKVYSTNYSNATGISHKPLMAYQFLRLLASLLVEHPRVFRLPCYSLQVLKKTVLGPPSLYKDGFAPFRVRENGCVIVFTS